MDALNAIRDPAAIAGTTSENDAGANPSIWRPPFGRSKRSGGAAQVKRNGDRVAGFAAVPVPEPPEREAR